MPIHLNEENDGRMLAVHVSGKLEKADYAHFESEFERLHREHGKLRVLFEMTAFHGWDAGAAWEDFKFGVEHFATSTGWRCREEKMAACYGDVRQAFHQSDDPVLRLRRRR